MELTREKVIEAVRTIRQAFEEQYADQDSRVTKTPIGYMPKKEYLENLQAVRSIEIAVLGE